MKKILIAALIASVSIAAFGYDIFAYVPISGKAKSYTCTNYSVTSKFGDYFRTPVSKITHNLNAAGADIESAEYTPRDVLLNKLQTSYDAEGNVSLQSWFNASNELIWKTSYTGKNASKSDASLYGKNGALKGKTVYTYDGDLLIDETSYNGNGTLVYKIVYKYDSSKHLTGTTQYFADGTLDEEKTYTYTDTGLIDSIVTSSTIFGRKQEIFRYAANGQLSEITTYGANNKVAKRLAIKYDDKGNVNKISDYNVSEKFGTTVNELFFMAEYVFEY